MAEAIRHAQMTEALAVLKGENTHLREEHERQKEMLAASLKRINNLASSYEASAVHHNSMERSSNSKVSNNPLFEGNGGIQARFLRLDFPKFDGADPDEWIQKAQ